MRKFFLSFPAVLLSCALQGQTLVNIGPAEVTVPEFLYVYNKGNGLEKSRNEKDIRAYLDLYIQFRMKVLDAESLGMDKQEAFIEELNGYRNRLAERYLMEREVSDKLVKEAYERSLKIINASHILVLCSADASPADTLAAYQKITSIRSKALNGTPFHELAATYSEEPGSAEGKGDLGNFSAFQMIYPFETAAYQTAEGQLSEIVRTPFGYHLIKVHDVKANPGQVEVEHILVASSEAANETEALASQTQAVEIYKRLLQGADFTSMANQFSDDKNSSGNGGISQVLTAGQSDKVLEKVAFTLNKAGDISAPVKTTMGWLIIRLIRKVPLPAFDQVEVQLRNRIAADERSVLGKDIFISRLKKQYDFKEEGWIKSNPEALEAKLSSSEKNENELLFTFSNEKVVFSEFLKFIALEKQGEQNTQGLYKKFVQNKLTSFENQHLEEKYPEFRFLLNEYSNGILLFNLSEQKIWNLAPADSSRLESFYKSRSDIYSWKERADARVYMTGSADNLKMVKVLLSQNKTDAEILAVINRPNPLNLVITAGLFERGSHMFVDRAEWKNNKDSEINIGNAFVLVKINKVLQPSVKTFAEIEGVLLTDYQQYLESVWLKELKKKYSVRINQAELKKISQ